MAFDEGKQLLFADPRSLACLAFLVSGQEQIVMKQHRLCTAPACKYIGAWATKITDLWLDDGNLQLPEEPTKVMASISVVTCCAEQRLADLHKEPEGAAVARGDFAALERGDRGAHAGAREDAGAAA